LKNAIIIFVRNPEAGKVKTRLAATVGNEQALLIYKSLLQHTFDISKCLDCIKFIYYADEIKSVDLWNNPGFEKKLQIEGDLGSKMKQAFKEVFADGYQKVLIIGSDCLQLTTAIIQYAFLLLDKCDVVLGPASDGGYYLAGMKKNHPRMFENKSWSTSTVYSSTLADLAEDNISVASLSVLTDVDTEEDWLASKNSKYF